MKRWRQYLTSAGATIAVFLMVSLAFAAPGEVPEEASDKAKEVQSAKEEKTKEPKATETDEADVEAQVEGEGEDTVNHGHCVSYWAHKSKADGLRGRARGQFISSIAQDEDAVSVKVEENATPDGKCGSYQGQLDQAKADAAASTSTARGKGKGAKGGPAAGS